MRQLVFSLFVICFAAGASAFEIEDRQEFGPSDAANVLRIISTADIDFFEPMITSFLRVSPEVRIDYIVASSSQVMQAIHDENLAFDIAISSAMDLQTKLANDGKALRHRSDATQALPDWAVWNDMLFAFTQEPAAIVVSKQSFGDLPLPRTRRDLITLMRQNPERFRGRVGTYDVRISGLGYLFATQDSRASETYWRLSEVMGRLEALLYCCSSDMIDAVKSGELLIAYNVLGSYVVTRADRDEFTIIVPSDFTTVMLRTALIPVNASSPDLSAAFLDHLLKNAHGEKPNALIHPALDPGPGEGALNRIRMGPGLLVFLDQMKKRAFLSEWQSAMEQE